MKGISVEREKPKLPGVRRLARAAVLVAAATVTVGGMVLGAGAAHAAVGTEPGDVTLSPASGATSGTPTWATSVACPTGFQGSAILRIVEASGSTQSISGAVASPTAPFGGTLLGSVSEISEVDNVPAGTTAEMVVFCFSGGSLTGTSSPEMDEWITISADGSSYTTSNTPPSATATTTTLTASPNPATTGATVTLTANTSAADGTNPAGSVQFEAGGSAIGSAVAVSATGVATTTTTFAAAGTEALSAVFTPTSSSYATSTGTYSETVSVATTSTTGSEPLAVTVPATGSFTLTVATGTVNLAVSGATATGALNPITVTDTRNTLPGWSVSGQTSDFTGSGSAAGGDISGNQLGWVPTDTSIATGATLGGTVTPASPGLGSTAAVLAPAAPGGGAGTSALGANLTLDIPTSAIAGPYAATLTVTAVTTGP
jgi:hypothetical protein